MNLRNGGGWNGADVRGIRLVLMDLNPVAHFAQWQQVDCFYSPPKDRAANSRELSGVKAFTFSRMTYDLVLLLCSKANGRSANSTLKY